MALQYKPRDDWENLHRFDTRARWTWREENKVVRKIDWRIMTWTAIMFTAIELDRANLAQSLAKWLGPDRWVPYNMFLQAGVIISSNIYRADDAPLYRRGNSILIGILCLNLVLYVLAKTYYIWRNRVRERKWDAMTPEEKLVYLSDHQDVGNKRLDFRLAS